MHPEGSDRRRRLLQAVLASDNPGDLKDLSRALVQDLADTGDEVELDDNDDLRAAKILTALHEATLRGDLLLEIAGRDRLVRHWHRFYETGDRWFQWAQQAVFGLIPRVGCLSLEEAWDLVIALVEAASDATLVYVGASPLEDLLWANPQEVLTKIEATAPTNARLQRALFHTWQGSVPTEIYARVQDIAKNSTD